MRCQWQAVEITHSAADGTAPLSGVCKALLYGSGGGAVGYMMAIYLPPVNKTEQAELAAQDVAESDPPTHAATDVSDAGSCGSEHFQCGIGAAPTGDHGEWGWSWTQLWSWHSPDDDTSTATGHRTGRSCHDATDLRALVARALDEAQRYGEVRGAKLLELSLSDCIGAARDGHTSSTATTVADIVEEPAGYDGAEAVTGWSVFWAVWLTILCMLMALFVIAGSPRSLRRYMQTGSRCIPLATLIGAGMLWWLYIRPPLEHVLVPSLEKMIERAYAFNATINVSGDKAEFMRSEDAWHAEINSLNRGFRLEIDRMMGSPSAPQPTLMLLYFSLTAAATYGVLVARAVQDVLPANVSTWLEPEPFPSVQFGWLIAIPAGLLVCWEGWVGYRVVSSALRLAVVMRGHVTALHLLGEELVAAAADGATTIKSSTLPWRETSANLREIVARLEGRRWGIKLAGFHMDKQFEAKFNSIFVKVVGLALFIAMPLIYAKVQVNKRDRKRTKELQKHRETIQKIQEKYEVLVLADELNAAELTDFKSSHVLAGGQAILFEATYKDETVAVKCTKDQDWSLATFEHELANRQVRSSDGSDFSGQPTDGSTAVSQETVTDATGTPEEGEPPSTPDALQPEPEPEPEPGPESEITVFARVLSAGGTHTEAMGLALCHHPNVLSYRGRVHPDKLKANAEFRAAFRKYNGKIPDEESFKVDGSRNDLDLNSGVKDMAAMRRVSRSGPQYRRYRDWYFNSVLITPYCVGRSLHDALYSEGPYGFGGSGRRIGEVRLLVAARSIARGMKYLHERNLVHNDLKPKNILLDSVHWGLPSHVRTFSGTDGHSSDSNSDWCCPHVKIGDFGLCEIGDGIVSGAKKMIGTDPYMSPEMLSIESSPEMLDTVPQKKRCDIYSFGMLLLTMVERKEPWEEQLRLQGVARVRQWVQKQETVRKLATLHAMKGRPPIPTYVDDDFEALIQRCWHHNPDERPLFEQVFSDLRSLKGMLVLARDDLSGTLWEAKVFSRNKKGAASQPNTDGKHRKGVETLREHGICTFEALHEAVHRAKVERQRLATLRHVSSTAVAEDVPPTPPSPALAALNQRQLDQVERWLNGWQHYH